MKKALIIAALILAMETPALASWNINFWGSDDNQHKHRHTGHAIERPEPGPPVYNVPEPGTLILLSLGAAALVIGGAAEGRKHGQD
jgi:hypothetical protein